MHSTLLVQAAIQNPTFKLAEGYAGVSALDPSLTINSTTVTPTFRYKGGDANATDIEAWTYGETLALQAGTLPSFNQGSPLLGDNDDSVQGNGGGYYQADGTSFADITTEDFVIEAVFKFNSTSALISKRNGSSPNEGYTIYVDSTLRIELVLDIGAVTVICQSDVLTPDVWYHAMLFVDRSGSGVWYINAIQQSAAALAAVAATVTNSANFNFCSGRSGLLPFDGNIAYLAMWQQDDWLDTHLQADIALERFNKLIGIHPQKAEGTATPATQTRATIAQLDKLELPEETNLLVDGDMEAAGVGDWTVGTPTNDDISKETTGPHGGSQWLKLMGTGAGDVYVYQSILTIGSKYRVTGWAKGDGARYPIIKNFNTRIWTGTTSTSWQYFDFEFTATNSMFRLENGTSMTPPQHVGFDDIKVTALLTDGDMETDGVGAWTAINDAVVTKETTNPYSGTQVLRVARNGATANPRVEQQVLVIDHLYRITGWARSDGNVAPRVYLGAGSGAALMFTGTTSTDWQPIDFVGRSEGDDLLLATITSTGTQYTEWDQITVELLGDRKIYEVGAGWLRNVHRIDSNGSAIKGYLAETAAENKCLQSENLATTWTLSNTGTDIIVDGDMEAVGVADWSAGSAATLTKETVSPHGGVNVLRVAYGTITNPFASQTLTTIGATYRLTGWARGDGTQVPRVVAGATVVSTPFSATTDWQYFDVTYVADVTTIKFYCLGAAGYTEWDDIQVLEITDHFDEQLLDGDMEGEDVSNWTGGNNPTLTKDVGAPHSGTRNLRIAYIDTNRPFAHQNVVVVGNTYRITGWGKSDGTLVPSITQQDATALWTGTNGGTWEHFDILAVATGTRFLLYTPTTGAGHVEFDDVKVSLITETAPNKQLEAMSFVAGPTDDSHRLAQDLTTTVATWTFSCFAKKGDQDFILMQVEGIANQWFDLDNGTVETGTGTEGFIEDWGNGWYRCGLSYTGVAALAEHRLYPAPSDGLTTFAGDGAVVNSYFWGMQVELGAYMSSYVQTTVAAVTRNADILDYATGDNIGLSGRMAASILLPDHDQTAGTTNAVALANNGTVDWSLLGITGNSDVLTVSTRQKSGTTGAVAGLTDIVDGVIHEVAMERQYGKLQVFVDKVEDNTADTTDVLMPEVLDEIGVGYLSYGVTGQLGGVVSKLRIEDTLSQTEPTFTLFSDEGTYGVDALPASLKINGTTVTPTFRYKGGDADATNLDPWTYGEILPLQAGTAPSYNQGSPGLGSNDDSVLFNGGGYYQAAASTSGDVTTEDMVIEAIIKAKSGAGARIFSKEGVSGVGYNVRINSSLDAQLTIDVGGTNVDITSAPLTAGCWYHIACFVDRSGSAQWYVNGVASGVAFDITSVAATIASTGKLSIAAKADGTAPFSSNIAYLAMWKQDAWLDTHLQATIAQERFNLLTGLMPQRAGGTAIPTTQTRATVAYLDKLDEANVLLDGDMELDGVANWIESNVTATKETGSPYQGAQVLRVTGTGANAFVNQNVLTVGEEYRITGWGRSDGVRVPAVQNHVTGLWTGTTSTDWQWFDETFTAAGGPSIKLTSATGQYTEYDSIRIVPTVSEGTDRKLYQVGSGWLRVVEREDSASSTIRGYLAETATENLCLQSEDMGTTWTKQDAGDTVGGSILTPNKTLSTTAGLIADSTDGGHGFAQSVTLTAVTYTFSVFAKKGDNDWLRLRNTTVVSCDCFFDLANGVLGTKGAGATEAFIEDWGNGWYRCGLSFTGTVAAHSFYLYSVEADLDNAFVGDSATINTYFWGAQVEIGEYMRSYVPTTTAAATRNKDELTYKGDDGNLGGVGSDQTGTINCDMLMEDYDNASGGRIASLSAGGSTSDRINFTVSSVGDIVSAATRSTVGNNGASSAISDVVDGVIHSARVTWAIDSLRLYVDGVAEGAEDTDCGMPDNLDQIDIGMFQDNTNQLNGVVGNIKIYKKSTRK